MTLKLFMILYVVLSTLDMWSTLYAEKSGYTELNLIVRWFQAKLGVVGGLVTIKAIAFVAIIALWPAPAWAAILVLLGYTVVVVRNLGIVWQIHTR